MPIAGGPHRGTYRENYGPQGTVRLMSRTVADPLYRQHGKEAPLYKVFFLMDENGDEFPIGNNDNTVEERLTTGGEEEVLKRYGCEI